MAIFSKLISFLLVLIDEFSICGMECTSDQINQIIKKVLEISVKETHHICEAFDADVILHHFFLLFTIAIGHLFSSSLLDDRMLE